MRQTVMVGKAVQLLRGITKGVPSPILAPHSISPLTLLVSLSPRVFLIRLHLMHVCMHMHTPR